MNLKHFIAIFYIDYRNGQLPESTNSVQGVSREENKSENVILPLNMNGSICEPPPAFNVTFEEDKVDNLQTSTLSDHNQQVDNRETISTIDDSKKETLNTIIEDQTNGTMMIPTDPSNKNYEEKNNEGVLIDNTTSRICRSNGQRHPIVAMLTPMFRSPIYK